MFVKMRNQNQNILVYIVALIAATGGLLFGFDTGVISGALLFLRKTFHLGSVGQEVVVSSVLIGCVFGAGFSGYLTDFLGRRKIILLTALIFAVGTILSCISPSVGILIGGRVIIGLAIGIASYTVPLYISEMSPPAIRGALVSLNQLMITIGILLSYFVDEIFANTAGTWRWMFFMGLLPAVILFVGMYFLPGTPRWLATKGRTNEARDILVRLGNPDPDRDLTEMQSSLQSEQGGLYALFSPWLRPTLFIGIGIMFIQQCTGINTVIYYAPTIFEMAGFTSARAAIGATVGVGLVNVLLTIAAIYLVDRLGRKPLLYTGLSGMTLSLFMLGLAFYLEHGLGSGLKWVAVCSLLIYIASFAISLGPIAWLIISEIYPVQIRGMAMSLATLSNWVFNFLVTMTFLSLVEFAGKAGTFWLYSAIGALGLIFCFFYVPETKGIKLEEIETNLLKGKKARELGKT